MGPTGITERALDDQRLGFVDHDCNICCNAPRREK